MALHHGCLLWLGTESTRDEGLTRVDGKAALRDLRGWGIVLNLVLWTRALPR